MLSLSKDSSVHREVGRSRLTPLLRIDEQIGFENRDYHYLSQNAMSLAVRISLRRRSRSVSTSNLSKPTARGCFLTADRLTARALTCPQAQGDNVDFVTKFEKELRKRHRAQMTEFAKIEHLICAFEKGGSPGAKKR